MCRSHSRLFAVRRSERRYSYAQRICNIVVSVRSVKSKGSALALYAFRKNVDPLDNQFRLRTEIRGKTPHFAAAPKTLRGERRQSRIVLVEQTQGLHGKETVQRQYVRPQKCAVWRFSKNALLLFLAFAYNAPVRLRPV